MQTDCTITIDASPDKVFDWLDDPEKVKAWVSGMVEHQDLHKTEDRIGSTFRQVVEEDGRRVELQGTVTQYVANQRLAVHLHAKNFEVDADYRLEDVSGRTRLTQAANVRFLGLMKVIGLLIAPFARKTARRQQERDLSRLKELCEHDAGG